MSDIDIKNPKLFSESWNNLSEYEKITCKQSAEAQEERLKRLQHIEWEKQHNLRTVYPKVEWTDRGSLKDTSINLAVDSLSLMAKSFTQKIADYVESQIKEFLEDNKISEKEWLKRGVIQVLPNDIPLQSYILYYKKWRKEYKRKVTITYNFITNPEELTIKNCNKKHAIAENPYSEVSAAIPCYTQGCNHCIYKN